ncbi:MAG: hypothetical protein M3441_28845 [Chloroflexota bacterium]|nr:hypothetical protein [Chloroflexota bacterium]
MQHRGVVLSRGLIFFCIASSFVLGLFVVPAIAQDTGAGPPAGTPVTASNPDNPSSPPDLVTISAQGCRVSEGASVTLEDGDGTTARFVDGQQGIEITARGNQISIQGPNDDFIGDHAVETSDPGFDTDGDYAVVSTTDISCQGTDTNQQPTDDNIGGDNNANAAQDQSNAADAQYADDVIKGTIPDKKILVDTGGPILPMIGGVILAIGLVGLGIFLLRRT